jgi:hypothetical protein
MCLWTLLPAGSWAVPAVGSKLLCKQVCINRDRTGRRPAQLVASLLAQAALAGIAVQPAALTGSMRMAVSAGCAWPCLQNLVGYAHEVLRMPLPSTLGPGIRSSYVSSCVCCTALWLVVCMHTM